MRGGGRRVVTFADAAEAWLRHGERQRNLKRSSVRDYRQVLDAYLLPSASKTNGGTTSFGRARFADTPLDALNPEALKAWHDALPYGRTAEKLLTIVRAVLEHARRRGQIADNPAS